MAFRYINPGYGALTGDSSVETFENATYNPTNGVAFRKYGSSMTTIKIPLPQGFTSDIYGKFDLYFNSDSTALHNFTFGAFSNYNTSYDYNRCIGLKISNSRVNLNDGYSTRGNNIQLSYDALNSMWFHWHRDLSIEESFGEAIINGTEVKTTYSNNGYNYSFSADKCFFITIPTADNRGDKVFISNVIVSDEYISPKERIIALPINQTITDMTAGASGIFIADAANQSLLQSVDVAQLIQDYGADSAITGIALAGNPAYRTGEAITTLTGLSKSGNVITEHDTCELSEASTSAIVDGWGLSGVTIADLQNMQFGWKAGA